MPWIRIGTALQIFLALVVDPGICTIMTCFNLVGWILLVHANSSVTNECDAPESNNTLASTELTENIPSTMSGASWASSACMRNTVVAVQRVPWGKPSSGLNTMLLLSWG